ncbi:MAG: UDP-N-acetylglucosamine--N-acetylmuramyl-(pentapeptide) pyrophosphoryl-undecaprenol N-acetylglucosamine transferase [Candidatus Nanopelagicales bacterium]|jgi:UDP-N-acetylglucosamine--N-acetylmuramyl-(pentapeptide) pyrophosphoryl-undecaprenol N-acetylglucosamine transferase
MHVVFAAGGTAGHLEPALNTADALIRIEPSTTISFVGGSRGLEGDLVEARGYPLIATHAQPMPRRLDAELLTLPGHTWTAVRTASAHLRATSAAAVVGFGGYAAVPGYLAARRTRTPLFIHEANSRPGFANRLGAHLTSHVAVVHDGVLAHSRHMGLPLRPSIAHLDRAATRLQARDSWTLAQDRPVVLVFGGSQGARHLNEVIAGSIETLTNAGIQVLHSVGRGNVLPDEHPGYRPVAYIDRMDVAYAAADLVVCRSGAMTCAELTAVGLPGIYVPLPIGNGEQAGNSRPIVAAGGGMQRADEALTSEWLTDTVMSVVQDKERLAAMSDAAYALGDRRADEHFARWILDTAVRGKG